jgi:hypothetical protein
VTGKEMNELNGITRSGKLIRNVVFLHIPKSGGSSIRDYLRDMVSADQVFEESRLHNVIDYESVKSGSYYLYMSHLGFHFSQEASAASLTLLRHPIDRLLSLYSYYSDPGSGVPLLEKDSYGEMSIMDFFSANIPAFKMNFDNQQVWQIGYGYHIAEREFYQAHQNKHISVAALDNLRKIDVVGTTENIGRFLEKASDIFKVEMKGKINNSNVSKSRVKWEELNENEKKLLESRVELEWVLFDYAKRHS